MGRECERRVSSSDFVATQGYFLNLANVRNVHVATIAMMFSVMM